MTDKFISLALSLTLLGGCSNTNDASSRAGPQPGTALLEEQPSELHDDSMGASQVIISMLTNLENISSQVIVVKKIEVLGDEGIGSTIRVAGIQLAPRPPNAPPYTLVPWGEYPTDPPVALMRKSCVVQQLRSFQDYAIQPGDAAAIATRIEVREVGSFRIEGYAVTYEQGNKAFIQMFPNRRSATVRKRGKTLSEVWTGKCLHRAVALPGQSFENQGLTDEEDEEH